MFQEMQGSSSGGGGVVEPLVVFAREINSGMASIVLPNSVVSQYKYAKLMTSAEYSTYAGGTAEAANAATFVTKTSCKWYTNAYGGATNITLSTTPTLISNVTLGSMSSFQNEDGGELGFALMLYNE